MISKREWGSLLACLVAWCGAISLVTALGGSWGIARNDDWSFILNAFHFHDTGIVAVGGWVQMNLIGQLVLAWPLIQLWGDSIVALQVLGLLCAAVFVIMTYVLARMLLPPRLALYPTLAAAVSPVVLPLSVSFMTDIPAAAGQLSSLALATVGLRRRTPLFWWASLVVGLWAFTVREYSLAALVAVVCAAWLTRSIPRSQRVIGTVVVIVGIAGVLAWRATQVTETATVIGLNVDGAAFLWALPVTLGFLTLPVVAVIQPARLLRCGWGEARWIPLVSGAIVGGSALVSSSPFVGNYFQQTPPYSQVLLGIAEPLFPTWMWWVMAIAGMYGAFVGIMATFMMARDLRREWKTPAPAMTIMALYAGGMFVLIAMLPLVARVPLFDRYLIGLAAIAPIPVLAWAHSRNLLFVPPVPAVVGTSVVALAGVTVLVAAAQLDGARWAVAEELHSARQIPRGNIDAGFDWYRYQTEGIGRPDTWPPRFTWWTIADPRAVCVTVSYAQLPVGGDSPVPDERDPAVMARTVWTPFATYELSARSGPDSCT